MYINISLIVQAVAAFLVFFFASIAITIIENSDEKTPHRFKDYVGSISFVLAIVLAIFYVCNAIFVQEHTGLQIFLFVIAIIFYCLCVALGYALCDFKCHGFITLVLIIFCIVNAYNIMASDIYNKNVIEQSSPKVQTQQYEVIAASSGTKLEGSIHGEASGEFKGAFTIQRGSITSNVDGKIEQTDVYKFYYIANNETGEIRLMTINAKDTSLFFTKEGEKPYLLKKVYTPYSLDYNVDPPQECNFGTETVKYELHVPKDSIVEGFEFNSND